MRKELYRSQFRLPQALYESLKDAADANQQSVNAELVARLEQSFAHSADAKSSLSHADATVRVLSEMYEQTTKRVDALRAKETLSPEEKLELQHEEETARHLRYATARANVSNLTTHY